MHAATVSSFINSNNVPPLLIHRACLRRAQVSAMTFHKLKQPLYLTNGEPNVGYSSEWRRL